MKLKDIEDKTQLTTLFYESSDPSKIDTIEKIHKDLRELKTVMHKNIESVLMRGEKIETLIMKTEALSENSKRFYVTAKKMNSCCIIM
jgi:synaptobrevin family protein YKT6